MKKSPNDVTLLVLGALLLAAVGRASFMPSKQPFANPSGQDKAASLSSAHASAILVSAAVPNAATNNSLAQALKDIFSEKNGWHVTPPAVQQIKEAVATGDEGTILRAFHEVVYSQGAKMAEVIPALKAYLNDANPFVRFEAAMYLYTAGDDSGYQTLAGLVNAGMPMMAQGQDLRVWAATTLAQFRQGNATQAIYDLYRKSQGSGLIGALVVLHATQIKTIIDGQSFYAQASALVSYGQANIPQFIPQITSLYENSTKPDQKLAAAWALTMLTGNQSALDYVIQAAQPPAKNGPGGAPVGPNLSEEAIKYLGSVQDPRAKQALEAALDSPDISIVGTAVVNLLFNQGGSDKAIEVVAQQLEETSPHNRWMGWELTLNIAAQLRDNPRIQAAGRVFAQKSQDGSWQLYTVERKDWPIYNWIDSYVIKLNKKTGQ